MIPLATLTRRPLIPAWTPASLSGLLGWWNMDDGNRPDVTVNTTFDAWPSIAGTWTSLAQATLASRPTLRSGWYGDHWAANFVSSDWMRFVADNSSDLAEIGGLTVYAVAQHTGTGTTQTLFHGSTATSANQTYARAQIYLNTATTVQMRGRRLDTDSLQNTTAVTVDGSTSWAAPHIIGGIWDWTNAQLYCSVDGTETSRSGGFQSAGVTDSTTSDRISMSDDSVYAYQGYVTEYVVVQQALSTTDRRKLEGYLAHHIGLAGSLPVDHPYKLAPP